MSWVEPVGYLRLLRGIPLEPSYENTLYFTSATEQYNYFFNHPGISFDKLSYTRYNRGIIRVPRNIRECYDINYMMYCNDSGASPSGNRKWFYCFVTEVNYISEGATEIVFQPDVLQTWMFNYTLGRCFVERQHTETDEIGEWIEDEGLETGPYFYEELQTPNYFSNWCVVVACDLIAIWEPGPLPGVDGAWSLNLNPGGAMYGGVYGALQYLIFNVVSTDAGGNTTINQSELHKLNKFFQSLISGDEVKDYTEKVVSVFMVPTSFTEPLSGQDPTEREINPTDASIQGFYIEKKIPIRNQSYRWQFTDPETGQSYYARNNKMYTYPYTGLLVTNQQSYTAVYPYEFLSPNQERAYFSLECLLSPETECQLVPYDYKGVHKNYLERITLSGFPVCSYTTDSYKAWLAQAGSAIAIGGLNIYADYQQYKINKTNAQETRNNINRISSFMPRFANFASLEKYKRNERQILNDRADAQEKQNLATSLSNVIQELQNTGKNMFAPFPYSGKQSSALNVATKSFGFKFYNVKISENYARTIDDFFTRFGYRINRNIVPNRYARTRWTYMKLSNVNFLDCNIPTDIAEEITQIYENGTTWWRAMWHMNGNVFVDDNPIGDYDFGPNSLRT